MPFRCFSKNGEGGPLKIGQAVAASRGRIASWFLSGNCQGHPYGLGQHFIWVLRTRLGGMPTSPIWGVDGPNVIQYMHINAYAF